MFSVLAANTELDTHFGHLSCWDQCCRHLHHPAVHFAGSKYKDTRIVNWYIHSNTTTNCITVSVLFSGVWNHSGLHHTCHRCRIQWQCLLCPVHRGFLQEPHKFKHKFPKWYVVIQTIEWQLLCCCSVSKSLNVPTGFRQQFLGSLWGFERIQMQNHAVAAILIVAHKCNSSAGLHFSGDLNRMVNPTDIERELMVGFLWSSVWSFMWFSDLFLVCFKASKHEDSKQ